MLKSLQISNYALIDSLDVSFPEGLIIISGQTGAGKSILLGALSLLLGAKAESSAIGGNADSCVVEAVFSIPASDSVLMGIINYIIAKMKINCLLCGRFRTLRSRK